MRAIAKINESDRRDLFINTATKKGLTEAIIEKDYWVCFMLDYLFHRSKWKNNIAFKGGTSLSKSYNLIKRFSEDIDLILDWRVIGYTKDEPWKARSVSKQNAFNNEANAKTEEFLREVFLPELKKDMQNEISAKIDCYIDKDDPQTVVFAYPQGFEDSSILSVIRLEIGALAAWTPAAEKEITPFVAEEYPRLFKEPSTSVLTVLPERTFWEKITILHREANRPENSKVPQRYSRHYYDIYCMANSSVKDSALKDFELLSKVVEFKDKFYHCSWAKYEEAKKETIKLLPPEYNVKVFKEDYGKMQNMLYGEKPDFDAILEVIKELEKEINNAKV